MNARLFAEVFVTLTVIMDPPGAVPVFLAVTRDLSSKERKRAAFMAVLTAFFVITLFAVAGRQILGYLHVEVPSLQIAGGLLLLLVALQLLQDDEVEPTSITPEQRASIGMVPLGTPLLAGPGAIVATIIFTQRTKTGGQWLSLLSASSVYISFCIWPCASPKSSVVSSAMPASSSSHEWPEYS